MLRHLIKNHGRHSLVVTDDEGFEQEVSPGEQYACKCVKIEHGARAANYTVETVEE